MIQENIMSQEPGTSKNQVRDKQVVPKSQVLYCYLFGAEERQGKKKEEKKWIFEGEIEQSGKRKIITGNVGSRIWILLALETGWYRKICLKNAEKSMVAILYHLECN